MIESPSDQRSAEHKGHQATPIMARTGACYREGNMYQHLTKLLPGGVVAVVLLGLGTSSILTPAWAKEKTCAEGNASACTEKGPKIVFTTKDKHDGKFGGLAGADAFCNSQAARAGLLGLFQAWMGTPLHNAPTARFSRPLFQGQYTRTSGGIDGVKDVWNGTAELFDDLSVPNNLRMNVDQFGGDIADNSIAWTAVDDRGNYDMIGFGGTGVTDDCNEWTSNSASVEGKVGATNRDNEWTVGDRIDNDATVACDTEAHVYCFEQ